MLVGLAGLSVINRYLLVPSLMVMIFAAVAVAGWTMLNDGRARTLWTVAALGAVLFGVVWTALRVDLGRLDNELSLPRQLAPLARRAARRTRRSAPPRSCGPVLTPNHRLIPDVRWIMNLPEDRVVARSDKAERATRSRRGSRSSPRSRQVFLRQGLDPDDDSEDDALRNLPRRPATSGSPFTPFYSAYARCLVADLAAPDATPVGGSAEHSTPAAAFGVIHPRSLAPVVVDDRARAVFATGAYPPASERRTRPGAAVPGDRARRRGLGRVSPEPAGRRGARARR